MSLLYYIGGAKLQKMLIKVCTQHQGPTGRGFRLRDGTGRVLAKKFGYRDGSGNEKILEAKNHIYRSPHLPAASSKSERVFSAAGNTVTPKRANLNPEKVEECVIVRCNLRLLKLMGLLETSVRVHLFIYSC